MDGFAPLDFSVTVKCLFVWLLVRPTEGRVAHSPDPDTVSDEAHSLSLSLPPQPQPLSCGFNCSELTIVLLTAFQFCI